MELTKSDTKIVLLSIDGLGGIESPEYGKTELEFAKTPNLDSLSATCETGLITHVDLGITPGSGPGHLALFGYPPTQYEIGRGVLSALGVGYTPKPNDLFFRGNFAIQDQNGIIIDRRAGRISTDINIELCKKLSSEIKQIDNTNILFISEKEHRFICVLNAPDLSSEISDTDPQITGQVKLASKPYKQNSKRTSDIINKLSLAIDKTLSSNKLGTPNTALFRGASLFPNIPTLKDRYMIDRAVCIATYPMYKGLSSLLGMDVKPSPDEEDLNHLATTFRNSIDSYDFCFIHVKKADSYGEDGNFLKKAEVIEKVDKYLLPVLRDQKDAVVCVTGDHSTPSVMAAHSWHPVPVLIQSRFSRRSGLSHFNERECQKGSLGIFPAFNLFKLLLAHAGRIKKFGA